MPESLTQIENVIDDEARKEGIQSSVFEFKDLESAEEYLKWKENIPEVFRKLIEGKIMVADEHSIPNTGLPLTDQFLAVLRKKLNGENIDDSTLDTRVSNIVKRVNRASTEVGYIDPLEYLTNKNLFL